MNKPYFAMLLPSEKKYKDGEIPYNILVGEEKMYLCTQDIKVGDVVWERLTTGEWMEWKIDTENDIDLDSQAKVIGLISPNAKWVNEDDEFTSDQVKEVIHYEKGKRVFFYWIECPVCKSFH